MIKHLDALDTTLLSWKIHRMVASSVPGLVDGDARQISISFAAIDSASVDPSQALSQTAPPPAPSSLATDVEPITSAWTWQRVLPIAALATFLIGVVLLWLRQSNSAMARRIGAALGGPRSPFVR
jgi:hypothetical protein